jgi:SAM-dependent methyltransferase
METSEYTVMAAVEDRHWWYGGMRAIAATLLDEVYAERHDLTILDAGCGTGANLRFLRRYGRTIGIDFAPEAVAYSVRGTDGTVARGSVLALPFNDQSFDLVTSFEVLYHRGVPDEMPALLDAYRVLRPGGRILIRLPAFELLRGHHDQAVHGRRRYTEPEVCGLLEAAGFVIERSTYVNSLLMPLALAQRLAERFRPVVANEASDLMLPHPIINEAFRWPLVIEAALIANEIHLPMGVSVLCRARRER